jgi:hypothetical protein
MCLGSGLQTQAFSTLVLRGTWRSLLERTTPSIGTCSLCCAFLSWLICDGAVCHPTHCGFPLALRESTMSSFPNGRPSCTVPNWLAYDSPAKLAVGSCLAKTLVSFWHNLLLFWLSFFSFLTTDSAWHPEGHLAVVPRNVKSPAHHHWSVA